MATLCREIYGKNTWRYQRSDAPERVDRNHLAGLDRSKLPSFKWSAHEQKADQDHNRKKEAAKKPKGKNPT